MSLPLVNGGSPTPAHAAVTAAENSGALFHRSTVLETLQHIVDLSLETVTGCDGASISFVQDETVVTPVWTDDVVIEVDALQYVSGEGPCLDAITHGATFYASDLSTDPRWPVFGPLAASNGMHSLLSLRLGRDHTFGSLNLYARSRAAYELPHRLEALAYSIHAGIALSVVDSFEAKTRAAVDGAKRLDQLEQVLSSRQTIALAQGMLMADESVDEQEAFALLRESSLRVSRRLIDVAECVVKTGKVPSGPMESHR